jgi:anti-anti-sigma regulatory factor
VTQPIELATELTVAHATELQRTLKERLATGALIIDASRVTQVDTSILQLLVSASRACTQRGVAYSWTGVSDSMRRCASLIGVAEFLHFP